MLRLSGVPHILLSLLLRVVSYGVYIVMLLEISMVCNSSFILVSIRRSLFVCFRSWSSFCVLVVGECTCLLYISCALFVVDFISVHLSRTHAGVLVVSLNRLIIPD